MAQLFIIKYESTKTKEVYANRIGFGVPVSSISVQSFGITQVVVEIEKHAKCEFHNYPDDEVIIRSP